ncbi:MAG: TRAP transporter large permease [Syntrophomonadaceae bacterium]|jgi:tripartite ATP-independent transporter DctM subunit|nr:TRAP transporter large permease [Syntrophomonadaceae bacterium]
MSSLTIGLIGILFFFLLIILRMPIAFAMALVGFVGFSYMTSTSTAMTMVVREIFSSFSSYSLSVIAMFCWMGFLAYYSGIGTRLYTFAYRLMGHWTGGLAIATQFACGAFGAICGSNTATAATMGAIALPEMRKYKYDNSLATASVGSGGVLGVLIPPSVIFIVYGMATEQSIGRLFIAGILPGILLMALYQLTIMVLTRMNPALAPAGPRFSWKERLDSLKGGLGEVLVVFAISMGGLFAGWFTATEAGAVGAAGVLLVALIGRAINWDGFKNSLYDTTRTTAMIMLLIAGSVIFGRFMAVSRIPFELASWTASLDLPAFMVMAVILFIYLILGCFIDALAMILLTIPIFYPIAVDTLGYDPIWFGVIIVLVVAMGVITPPVGMNIYILKGVVPDIPLETMFKGVWPFLLAIIVCLVLIMIFPQIALFLPNLIAG